MMILFDRSTLLVKYASDETESLNKPPISNKREQHTRVNHTRIQLSTFYIQTSRRVNYDVTRTSVYNRIKIHQATRFVFYAKLHEISPHLKIPRLSQTSTQTLRRIDPPPIQRILPELAPVNFHLPRRIIPPFPIPKNHRRRPPPRDEWHATPFHDRIPPSPSPRES